VNSVSHVAEVAIGKSLDDVERVKTRLARRIAPSAACFLLVAAAYLIHFAVSGYGRFHHDSERFDSPEHRRTTPSAAT
jgi:hypothetical protein